MFSLITSTCRETFKNEVYSLKTSFWGSRSPHSKQKYFGENLKITIILTSKLGFRQSSFLNVLGKKECKNITFQESYYRESGMPITSALIAKVCFVIFAGFSKRPHNLQVREAHTQRTATSSNGGPSVQEIRVANKLSR